MIGVVCKAEAQLALREFFELFKTPWEYAQSEKRYPVVLVADENAPLPAADLVVVYGSRIDDVATGLPATTDAGEEVAVLDYQGQEIPIYRGCRLFPEDEVSKLKFARGKASASAEITLPDQTKIARVGYDLPAEVDFLLRRGQPVEFAQVPTLDRHIAFLRDLMRENAIAYVEIPPRPFGHPFIACLTHDMDHPRIQFHNLDHTVLGFVYRATLGSILRLAQGRISLRNLLSNLAACVGFPFMKLRWVKDCWDTIDDYLRIEQSRPATYLYIPFKGKCGRSPTGAECPKRAAAYGAEDVAADIDTLTRAGKEIAVHGIDAWRDATAGMEERNALIPDSDTTEIGIRMHWLYFDEKSPAMLEAAGYTYDSTIGYNETIGFRAGTSQAFRPLNANRLLELPLNIMDTALFYPSHLNLDEPSAEQRVKPLTASAETHGGILTVNWHDRSIAPERQWKGLYLNMIAEWSDKGAWFASMGQAAAWFRKRRAARFDEQDGMVYCSLEAEPDPERPTPGLMMRHHRSNGSITDAELERQRADVDSPRSELRNRNKGN